MAPKQLLSALRGVGRTVRGLAFILFVAAGILIYSWPALFWGSVYDEHQWNPLPEPHRTILVVTMFCLASFWLYVLRCKERVVYSAIEIVAAILTFYFTVVNKFPVETRLDSSEYVTACVQIAAGLYIFVRGLDNIGNGLTPGSKMYKLWRSSKFFSEAREQGGA